MGARIMARMAVARIWVDTGQWWSSWVGERSEIRKQCIRSQIARNSPLPVGGGDNGRADIFEQ